MTRTNLARALLIGPLGLLVVAACIGFTIGGAGENNALDWLVTGWSFVSGVANLLVGARLNSAIGRRALPAVTANYLVFSLVKLIGYGESAGIVFGALALIALALATTASQPPVPRLAASR